MLQRDEALAALLTIGWPRGNGKNRHFEDRQAVLRGNVDANGAVSLSPWVMVTPRPPKALNLRLGKGGQSLSGEIAGLPVGWKCGTTSLSRQGAPDVPKLEDPGKLAGDWSGYDFGGDVDPIRGLASGQTYATRLVLTGSADGLFGRYDLTSPVTAPLAQQDRYRATVQVLFRLKDGRPALVPVKDLRVEGRFASRSGPAKRGYLLAVSPAPDGSLQLDRFENAARPERASHVDLHATDTAEQATLDAGQAPRVAFPPPIGGALMAAPSLDAQCRVMMDWTKPIRAVKDPGNLPGGELRKQTMPMYSDDSFQAFYGVPFSLTMQPERRALHDFMTQICARRHNDDILRWVSNPLLSEGGFNEMLSMLMNRRESSGWLDGALSEIDTLPDTANSRHKLDEIEGEAQRRRAELTDAARAKLAETIKAKRDAITVALVMERARAIPGLPAMRGTLAVLNTLLDDASAAPLSQAQSSGALTAARAKADAILGPLVQPSLDAAQAAPETLDGLAALTRATGELDEIADALGPRLGSGKVTAMAAPIRQRRKQMLEEPAIRRAFAKAMQSVEPRGDPKLAATSAASRYLLGAEFDERSGISFYADTVHDAVQRLEIASIAFADHSTSSISGEPSAKEMLLAVKAKFDQINEDLGSTLGRCQAGQFQGDPLMAMKCLTILGGGGGGRLQIRMTRFEKLGCANATVESGFICDYVLAFQSNSPFMQGEMARMMGAGSNAQGRFVHVSGGWIFVPI